ncbi:MAG TPA: hypothetical protein VMX17_13780 [Candidatus Glassbacteria bacterium]|nr:hypothetical protein [Candidatus Glassbacteria bacterium]
MIRDLIKDWESKQEHQLMLESYVMIDIETSLRLNEFIEKTRVERHNAIREQQIW